MSHPPPIATALHLDFSSARLVGPPFAFPGGACAPAVPPHERRVQRPPTVLRIEQWLPRPRNEVFPFFADARNLELITPDWLRFHILNPPPITMRVGLKIDYRLRIRGFPARWQSEITAWEPPFRFVDEQRRGPYRTWHHEHRFEEKDGGTLCLDVIQYAAPGGPLRPWIERWFVRPDVERIFAYRRRVLAERFGGESRPAPTGSGMRVPGKPG